LPARFRRTHVLPGAGGVADNARMTAIQSARKRIGENFDSLSRVGTLWLFSARRTKAKIPGRTFFFYGRTKNLFVIA
jgi:hypothetical protein